MADLTKLTDSEQDLYKQALQIGAVGLLARVQDAERTIANAQAQKISAEAKRDTYQAMLDMLTPEVEAVDAVISVRPVVEIER